MQLNLYVKTLLPKLYKKAAYLYQNNKNIQSQLTTAGCVL